MTTYCSGGNRKVQRLMAFMLFWQVSLSNLKARLKARTSHQNYLVPDRTAFPSLPPSTGVTHVDMNGFQRPIGSWTNVVKCRGKNFCHRSLELRLKWIFTLSFLPFSRVKSQSRCSGAASKNVQNQSAKCQDGKEEDAHRPHAACFSSSFYFLYDCSISFQIYLSVFLQHITLIFFFFFN